MTLTDGEKQKFERALAKTLGEANEQVRNLILTSVNVDAPSDLSFEQWQEVSKLFRDAITPELEKTFIASAMSVIDEFAYGIDFALVNQEAVSFASSYGFDLVSGITETRKKHLQKLISDFYTEAQDKNTLINRLNSMYSPVRSEMIAVTEVTRAASEGQRMVIAELEAQGATMLGVFNTARDEKVCPICSPLNGKRSTVAGRNPDFDGQGMPPLHVRCRCWVSFENITGVS